VSPRRAGSARACPPRARKPRPKARVERKRQAGLLYRAPPERFSARAKAVERIRRPVVEDLVFAIAGRTPRRAEMTLELLERILKGAEEGEPRFLTWEDADELRSWMPEYVGRIVMGGAGLQAPCKRPHS